MGIYIIWILASPVRGQGVYTTANLMYCIVYKPDPFCGWMTRYVNSTFLEGTIVSNIYTRHFFPMFFPFCPKYFSFFFHSCLFVIYIKAFAFSRPLCFRSKNVFPAFLSVLCFLILSTGIRFYCPVSVRIDRGLSYR